MNYRTLALTILMASFSSNTMAQETPTDQVTTPATSEVVTADEAQPTTPATAVTERAPIAKPTRYVADQFYVPLRETPCARCKIVHRGLKTGTKLKLIAIENGWALLRTDKGVEGWMEEQFITDSQIARVQLNQDKALMKKLKSRNDELEQVMNELRQQSKALRGKLDTTEGRKENLAMELANIKEISSDAIALNKQNQALVKQDHMLQRENDILKANYEKLQNDRRNESFLYGGITVFLGALLVVLIPKLRGRKRFSEWH